MSGQDEVPNPNRNSFRDVLEEGLRIRRESMAQEAAKAAERRISPETHQFLLSEMRRIRGADAGQDSATPALRPAAHPQVVARALANQIGIASELINGMGHDARRPLTSAEHAEAVALAIRAFRYRVVHVLGSDPVVAAVNATPEAHQLAAMGLVRSLAHHDANDAANPFLGKDERLAKIYDSEKRHIAYLAERASQQESSMTAINEALNGSEYELVIEAMTRLREIKVQAWREAQNHPATKTFTRGDFGIDSIDAFLKKLDVTIEQDTVPPAAPQPRVGIRVEGGAIQSVFANQEIAVDVISYEDEEDRDANSIFEVEWEEGKPVECVIAHYSAQVLPGEFPKIDRALANGPVAHEGNKP